MASYLTLADGLVNTYRTCKVFTLVQIQHMYVTVVLQPLIITTVIKCTATKA